PAGDLVPDDYVVAGVPDFSARPVVRLGVSAVLRGHGGTRDFALRRSPVEEESRYPDHVAVHCANRRRSPDERSMGEHDHRLMRVEGDNAVDFPLGDVALPLLGPCTYRSFIARLAMHALCE